MNFNLALGLIDMDKSLDSQTLHLPIMYHNQNEGVHKEEFQVYHMLSPLEPASPGFIQIFSEKGQVAQDIYKGNCSSTVEVLVTEARDLALISCRVHIALGEMIDFMLMSIRYLPLRYFVEIMPDICREAAPCDILEMLEVLQYLSSLVVF